MRAPARRRHGRMSPRPTATGTATGLLVPTALTATSRPRRLPTVASVASMPASPHASAPTATTAIGSASAGSVTGVRGGPRVTSTPLEEPAGSPSSSAVAPSLPTALGSLANGGSIQPTPPLRHGTKRPRASMCRRGSSDAGDGAARAVVACAPAEPLKTTPLAFAAAAHVATRVGLREPQLAGSLRARVQRLLVQFVMLPVVWVSLCCVITAAMGIEAVESIQKALVHDHAHEEGEDEEKRRPAKKAKRDAVATTKRRPSATRRRKTSLTGDDEEEDRGLVFKNKAHPLEAHAAHAVATRARPRRRVLIWDLDETLVLFASLYSGQFARTHGAELATSVALGEQMMTYLLAVLERHFFFSDLHDADIDHISCVTTTHETETDDASAARARLLADRYARIRAIYERRDGAGAADFLDDPTSQWFTARQALVTSIDMLSTGWIREARELLTLTSRGLDDGDEIINVMVTNTQLSPALCKCLIYGLDAHFPIESVYSSSRLHKLRCFETIRAKYGGAGDVEFIGIGDGAEEEQVSHALGMAFFKIRSIDDLRRLRHDLQLTERSATTAAPATKNSQPVPTRVASPPGAYAAATAANE